MKTTLLFLCLVYIHTINSCSSTSTVLSTISNFEILASAISNSGTTTIFGDSGSTTAPTGGGVYNVTGVNTVGGTTIS